MTSLLQWAGAAVVLLVVCGGAVGLAVAVALVPVRAISRYRSRRAPRTEASRAARDGHAAAVRDYCLISPDYTMAVALQHEGELTDLLGLALKLRENDYRDHPDEEDDHAGHC